MEFVGGGDGAQEMMLRAGIVSNGGEWVFAERLQTEIDFTPSEVVRLDI